METLGLLAAGVAHDINNVLGIILGEVGLLMSEVPRGSNAERSLEQISAATESAARFLRQLLLFSRRQNVEFKPLDLSTLLGDLTVMLSRLLGKRFKVELRCPDNLPHVHADLGMIEQLVLNLAVNSRDAMPEGGTLRITSSVVETDSACVRKDAAARLGTFVCLEVADTGCGMDHSTLQHLFEPFFSTKDPGQGTGLGLATVDSIVRRHHGWIEVESIVGAGAVFRVFLPVSVPAETSFVEPGSPVQSLRGRQETVLLVEDDSEMREIVSALLQEYGYRVLEAGCEKDALCLWEERHGNVDLLLLDVVMPGGSNSHGLARLLKSRRPDLRVIYSSGYSADVLADIIADTDALFLPKPYRSRELAAMVRQCLDAVPQRQSRTMPA